MDEKMISFSFNSGKKASLTSKGVAGFFIDAAF
jgi:hypothetical protein